MTGDPILEFDGEHRWLSNFYDYVIDLGGLMFPSAEHGYQAAKTLDPEERKRVQLARSPGQAKRLGRELTLRPDWEDVKLEVMRLVVAAKFPVGGALVERLLETGDRILVEGNHWHDTYWGACWVPLWTTDARYGLPMWAEQQHDDKTTDQLRGENHLGLLLMERRQQLKEVTA